MLRSIDPGSFGYGEKKSTVQEAGKNVPLSSLQACPAVFHSAQKMKQRIHLASDSNPRRLISVVLLSVNLILSGCVTPALWKAAEGESSSEQGIRIRNITSGFKSNDGNVVNVCMAVFDFARRAERQMTLSIPVQDRRKWKIQRNLNGKTDGANNVQASGISSNVATTYIEYTPTMSSLTPGCITDGERLPILVSGNTDAQNNLQTSRKNTPPDSSQKMPDAVYVINRDGQPVNIGYLSDKPIFENSYSIDVPLHYVSDQSGTGAKRYLYLLTPVTVVMDAAIVVLYVAALAYGGSNYQYQNQQPTLMIRATSINGISK